MFLQAQTPLSKFLSAGNLSAAGVSVLVRDVGSGETLIEHNSKTNRIPASLIKLLTTATAVELLTDTFRFQTRIEYDGFITEDSILNGNIYITGGGDPTLESTYRKTSGNFYLKSADAILGAGIRKINGRIIGDASLFEEYGAPFQWLVEDIGSYYSPTPSALSAHDNFFHLTLKSGASSVVLEKIQPSTNLLSPEMNFKTGGKKMSWRVSKSDYSWQPIFSGVMPVNHRVTIRTEIPEAALLVADSLSNLLRTMGIEADSSSVTARVYKSSGHERILIYTYYSEPLKNIIKETNYRSINLYAENIFSYIALQKDSIATTQTAANVTSSYWREKGLPAQKVFQVDGSGLSMKNAVNADFFVQLLVYMRKKAKYRDVFFSSLPAAGESGTVASFLSGTALSGKVYVKSGSMERVQNYSGYINHQNKWYAFCVMINNFEGERSVVQKQIGELLLSLF